MLVKCHKCGPGPVHRREFDAMPSTFEKNGKKYLTGWDGHIVEMYCGKCGKVLARSGGTYRRSVFSDEKGPKKLPEVPKEFIG